MARAVFTGAGSSIGAATARILAARGLDIVLIGRSGRIETTRDSIHTNRPSATITCGRVNLADGQACRELIGRLTDADDSWSGNIAAVIHAAGVGTPGSAPSPMDRADLEHAFAVNVAAPLALSQGLLGRLEPRTTPTRNLFIGSGVADKPQPGTGLTAAISNPFIVVQTSSLHSEMVRFLFGLVGADLSCF